MSFMGMQYTYCLASRYPTEAEAVIFAYTQAGWNYITHECEGAVPKRLIFEWPRETLYNKLCGKTEFKVSEVSTLARLLRLTPKEVDKIFFAR